MDNHEWLELMILANCLYRITGIQQNWYKVTVTLLTAAVLNHQEQSMETEVLLWKSPSNITKNGHDFFPSFEAPFLINVQNATENKKHFFSETLKQKMWAGVMCYANRYINNALFGIVWIFQTWVTQIRLWSYHILYQTQKNNATAWCRKPKRLRICLTQILFS